MNVQRTGHALPKPILCAISYLRRTGSLIPVRYYYYFSEIREKCLLNERCVSFSSFAIRWFVQKIRWKTTDPSIEGTYWGKSWYAWS